MLLKDLPDRFCNISTTYHQNRRLCFRSQDVCILEVTPLYGTTLIDHVWYMGLWLFYYQEKWALTGFF